MAEKVEKEKINQLKYMIETFGCKDKRFEDGFVSGLFYAITLLEQGKAYADKKIDWGKIGREDPEFHIEDDKCPSC